MDSQPPDLKQEREQLLQTFARGARLSEQLLEEREQLRSRIVALEAENAKLRVVVEADTAIRDLVQKIDRLELEKQELVSRFERAEANRSEFVAQVEQVENEFSNMANLYVAANQLHSSLSPRGVARRIKEVLAQFVGAERFAMYLLNDDRTELVPIAAEGMVSNELVVLRANSPSLPQRIRETLETATAQTTDGDPSAGTLEDPAAVIPLYVDDQAIGLVVIFATLTHKRSFDAMDFALFKLLNQHAASALVCASLFARAQRRIPGLEAFTDLSV